MNYYLKCDAEGCDHREERPDLLESDIGRPCPKCGENLLTREDYEAAAPLFAITKMLEKLGLAIFADDREPSDGKVHVSINPHKGDVNIKISGAS